MNDLGIKKQVKRHWRKLQKEISKPLHPPPPPYHIRVQMRNNRDRRARNRLAFSWDYVFETKLEGKTKSPWDSQRFQKM